MNDFEQSEASSSSFNPAIVFAALVGGVLLFLATKNPIAAAIVPALIAGWGGCASGLWVLKTDDDRTRARICFAFQVAAGCWQAAAAALFSAIACIVVAGLMKRPADRQMADAAMLALLTGVLLNTLIGLVAVVGAWRNGLRVWVHPKLRKTLEEESRLPEGSDLNQRRFNYATFVAATALFIPVLLISGSFVIIAFVNADAAMEIDLTPVVVMLLSFVAIPVLWLFLYGYLSTRIIARSPRECWPYLDE